MELCGGRATPSDSALHLTNAHGGRGRSQMGTGVLRMGGMVAASDPASPRPRSTFVTVLAGIGIVLAGLASFVGVIQNIIVWGLVRPTGQTAERWPTTTGHLPLLLLGLLMLFLVTLGTSVALLGRRPWARRVFIGLMALGIANEVGALVWRWTFTSGLPGATVDAPDLQTTTRIMELAVAVFATGRCVLFGWIIRKLASPAIRAEFS
jgi:hypothetical protein